MRLLAAAALGLLIAAGATWWKQGHPGYETAEQKRERIAKEKEAARPKLYRWRDADGALQLTAEPPAGRQYEVLYMDEERVPEVDGSRPPTDVTDTPENRP